MAYEKEYSFINATKLSEGVAFVTASGFVSRDVQIRETKAGDKVASFSIPLNNTGRKLTSAFGAEAAGETLWLNVSAFDNEHVKLATRVEKAIKARMKIAVVGTVKQEEYNGKINYNMSLRDFKIIWSQEKGTTVGGEYSFVNAVKASKEGAAFAGFEGFVARAPEMKEVNGKNVLDFSIIMNKAGKKITSALGLEEGMDEENFVRVQVWDNDNFPRAERAAKVLRKGAAFLGQGYVTSQVGNDGKTYFQINMDDFEILRGAKDEGANNPPVKQTVAVGAGAAESDFTEYGMSIDIDDDDLPF